VPALHSSSTATHQPLLPLLLSPYRLIVVNTERCCWSWLATRMHASVLCSSQGTRPAVPMQFAHLALLVPPPACPCRRPAVVLSYAVAGLSALLSSLCYAEFAVDMPYAGGAYTYISATLGQYLAWCVLYKAAWHDPPCGLMRVCTLHCTAPLCLSLHRPAKQAACQVTCCVYSMCCYLPCTPTRCHHVNPWS
jgi:hypothetical protein